jgi:hypothetical protein
MAQLKYKNKTIFRSRSQRFGTDTEVSYATIQMVMEIFIAYWSYRYC